MKFDYRDLIIAMEYFKYNAHVPDESEIEISVSEEDFEKGKICSSICITATYNKPHEKYDRIKSDKTITTSVEIFPKEERRTPRISVQESQELVKRED